MMRTCLIAILAALLFPLLAAAQPLADRVPENAILYVGWQGSQTLGPAYDQSRLKDLLNSTDVPRLFQEFLPGLVRRVEAEDPDAAQAMKTILAIGAPLWRHPTAIYFAGIDF
jgi:hypothetical protein